MIQYLLKIAHINYMDNNNLNYSNNDINRCFTKINVIESPAAQKILKAEAEGKESQKRRFLNHSWLNRSHPLYVNSNADMGLLAIIAGDSFIGGTPWEGYSSTAFLPALIDISRGLAGSSLLEKKERERIGASIPHLEQAYEIASSWEKLKSQISISRNPRCFPLLLRDCAEKTANRLKSAGGGWVVLGWCNNSGGGHTIMGHLQPTAFTVINTRFGIRVPSQHLSPYPQRGLG